MYMNLIKSKNDKDPSRGPRSQDPYSKDKTKIRRMIAQNRHINPTR